MAYGSLKVDNIIFTNGGVDQTITVSGIVASTSGNLTVTGTISGDVIRGGTTVSGATVTGAVGQFGNLTAVSGTFTTQISGATVTGTTANFTSGNFTSISGGTHTITSGVFAAGTAANPSISFTSDPNTGIYSPGADQVAISTNGTGRLFVDSSGNVGVGGTASANGLLRLNAASGFNSNLIFSENSTDRYLLGQVTGDNALRVFDLVANSERLRIDSSGRVGLGTSSPTAVFHAVASSASGTSNADGIRINSGGNVAINIGSNSSVGYGWIQSANWGSGYIATAINPNGGNVGIGTSSPNTKLSVVGTVGSLTEAIRVNSNAGTQSGNSGLWLSGNQSTSHYNWLIASQYNVGSALEITPSTAIDGSTFSTPTAVFTQTGRVGIGTTSPATTVHAVGTVRISRSDDAAQYLNLYASGGEGFIDAVNSNSGISQPIIFRSGDNSTTTERARIDSSGRLLVGTSTARNNFYNTTGTGPSFQIEGTDNNPSSMSLVCNFNGNTNGPALIFGKSNSTALGSNTLTVDGNNLGRILFSGNDGTEFVNAAEIRAEVDGTPGANDMPGRLVFSTTADGASSPTERIRITQNGALNVAAEGGIFGGAYATARFSSIAAASVNYANQQVVVFHNKGTSGTRYMVSFGDGATYTERGFITWDGSNMALVNSSDERLKTNITESNSAIESVKQINVRSFNFIENGNHVDYGFVAQELCESAPEAVNIGTDDEHGNIDKPWTVGYASLVPRLTKALQEAIAKIEALETKVAALEGA